MRDFPNATIPPWRRAHARRLCEGADYKLAQRLLAAVFRSAMSPSDAAQRDQFEAVAWEVEAWEDEG